jgi:hypothetical protein
MNEVKPTTAVKDLDLLVEVELLQKSGTSTKDLTSYVPVPGVFV